MKKSQRKQQSYSYKSTPNFTQASMEYIYATVSSFNFQLSV